MREGWAVVQGERVSFERERGVSAITVSPEVAYLVVRVPQPERITEQRQHILNLLREAEIPIFLIKLQRHGISFGVDSERAELAQRTLEAQGFRVAVKPRRVMVSVYAQNMRELHGVVAKIAEVLYEAGVAIEQLSDAHDRITCLIQAEQAPLVVERLRTAFRLPAPSENTSPVVVGDRNPL